MHRAAKWSLRLLAGLLLVLLLAGAAVVVVMNTERGTRWGVSWLATLAPGELEFGDHSGTLWRGLAFEAVTYEDAERRVEIDQLTLRVDWLSLAARKLTLRHLDARSVRHRELAAGPAPPTSEELAPEPLPIDIEIERSRIGELSHLSDGDAVVLRDIAIRDVWSDGRDVRVASAELDTANVSVAASTLATTINSDWPIAAGLRWRLADDSWSGRGNVRGSLHELHFDQDVAGPFPAIVSGSVQLLLADGPQVDMLVNWEHWSFGDQQLIDGEIRAAGWTDAYTVQYDATLQVLGDQRYAVLGTAAGNTDAFEAFESTLEGAGGHASVSGSVRWSPAFVARARARATDIDLAVFLSGVSGMVAAEADITVDDSGRVTFANLRADGHVNTFAARALGDVRVAAGRLRCDDCRVDIGKNRLWLDGELSPADVTMSLRLDAPQLDELVTGLGGSATATGTLSGALDALQLALELRGRQLRYGDTGMPPIDTDATLTLRRAPDEVTGAVRRATVAVPGEFSWSLQRATAFRLRDGILRVDAHRWTATTGDVWIDELLLGGTDVALVGRITELPLSLAAAWLPDNLQLTGFAAADVDLRRSGDAWTGTAEWRQTDTVLRVIEAPDRQTDVVVPTATLLARLRDGGLAVVARLAVEPGVTGSIDLELAELGRDAAVTAELRLAGKDWRWISAIVPQVDQFDGSINALVKASGPLSSPELTGDLTWRNGSLLVPALNVPLRDIELVVSGGTRGTATLAGSARAGSGTLQLAGRFEDLMQPERSLQLKVTGDSAEIVNWPEYRLWATPDLVLTADAVDWRVAGKLTVPRAEIALRELPADAVAVSPDVVVLGATEPEARRTRLSGEVDVLLGERVQIDALGLQARLAGNLSVRLREDRPVGGEGRILLEDGLFEAYGQKLTLRDGELVFTGPLDDPIVDVRAVRVIDTFDGTVTAGLHLTGRAQNLTTTVYSDPAMAEADALSYLVVGRPLNQATEAEGSDLTGAAVALGIKQASRLVEQIGQSLGLDQLSLTGDGGETTALVAGKQVNKRLYARYAYGVFSRLGTLLLRYRLSERLTLEAGTGDNQSIDILYSVER